MLSSKYIYSNYTFWHSKNNNRVGSRTHWINYESNLCPISYYLISRSPYYNRMTKMFFYGLLESVSILNKYPIDPRKSDSLTSTKCIVTFVFYKVHRTLLLEKDGRKTNSKPLREFSKVLSYEDLDILSFKGFWGCKLAHIWKCFQVPRFPLAKIQCTLSIIWEFSGYTDQTKTW